LARAIALGVSALLTPELLAHIGRQTAPERQIVTARDIRKYAIASGQTARRYLEGEVAPPLFHLSLFWPLVTNDVLSTDGVAPDQLIPELPLKRAMAGGLDITYHTEIRAGDVLVGTRTLTKLHEKEGRAGTLIFYEVVLEVRRTDGTPVLTETATRILR
jgi:hydroxyacyl-ACP dehydratase HTD2-like protein with hotdog domain